MKYTTNYNLKKPDTTDYVKIADLNDNADTIDKQLKTSATHTSNTSNPHKVTTSQIGAATATDLTSHTSNTSNPHKVTTSQIGAAEKVHTHSAADLASGVLSEARGGTGVSSLSSLFGTDTPKELGAAATGTSEKFARADHVHPNTDELIVNDSTNAIEYLAKFKLVNGKPVIEIKED